MTAVPKLDLAGRFQLDKRVGKGAFGEVFRAIDRDTGETVAVKRLIDHTSESSVVERFEREAAILASVSSPYVVHFVAYGIDDEGRPCIALEWLDGENLADRQRRAPLSVAASVDVARQAALGLAELHRVGVVHRDIKPANFVVTEDDSPKLKLLDLGIARVHADPGLTREGTQIGTPAYMSPEQARGDEAIGAQSDLFSLGVVLYELLARQKPFGGDRSIIVLAKIVLHDPPPLDRVAPYLPKELVAIVARAMDKSPDRRFGSADEMALALETQRGLDVRQPTRRSVAPSADATRPIASSTHVSATREQRVVSAVFAGFADEDEPEAAMERFSILAAQLGGTTHKTLGWRRIAVFGGARTRGDEALRAARLALKAIALMPRAELSLATGRALTDNEGLSADAIERGAGGRAPPGAISVDAPSARLLAAHFDLEEVTSDRFLLRGQAMRARAVARRTLVGRETPCVGRERELATIGALLNECETEPVARAVVLIGPPGAGKSRLRHEFMLGLAARPSRPTVLMGRADSLRAGSPLALLGDALRGAAGVLDGESPSLMRDKLAARIASCAGVEADDRDRIVAFLGEIAGIPFDDADRPALRAARADPELMGDQRRAAWVDFLRAECAAAPVVLVLEDLQWGDLPTVRFVDAALRSLAERSLFVLALARPELAAIFPGLWSERDPHEIRVTALTKKACEKLVRAVLEGADDATVAFVVDRAEGNAFYLEELIRAVSEGQTVLPDTVLGMVQARLDALGPEHKRTLRAASVFGQRFYRGGVARVCGIADDDDGPRSLLDDLEAREIVSRRATPSLPGRVEYVFRHALVRDTAYAMLPDEDRTAAHRIAGEWLEAAGETDAIALAEHFDRGGAPDRAIPWWRRGSEQALEGNDLGAALERANRGIACGADGVMLGALRLLQAEALRWRGDNAEAERFALEAVDLLPENSASWFRALGELLHSYARLGRVDDLERWVARTLEAVPLQDAFASKVTAVCPACAHLWQSGRSETAQRGWAWLATADVSCLDGLATARLSHLRGFYATRAGDLHAAYLAHREAAAAAERIGDMRNVCVALVNVGFAASELGWFQESSDVLETARQRARRYGLGVVEAYAELNLAHILMRLGKLDAARAAGEEALSRGFSQSVPRVAGAARLHLAHVALAEKDAARAEIEARRAADVLAVSPGLRSAALAALARALLAQGKTERALEVAREGVRGLESIREMFDGLVRLTLVQALEAAGAIDEARATLLDARDHLLRFASRIGDPEAKRAFLTNVPEHARVLELIAALPDAT